MLILILSIASTQLNIEVARDSALHHIQEGQWTLALEYAKIVVTESPDDYLLLGFLRYAQITDHLSDVNPQIEKAIKTNRAKIYAVWESYSNSLQSNVNILNVLMALYSTEYKTGAYKYAHKVLELDSLNGFAHYLLGHSAENDGDYSKALAFYADAIRLDTALIMTYSRMATMYLIKSDYDSSLAYYHRVPYGQAVSNSEHIGEAVCAIAKGNIDEAEQTVTRLSELKTTWYVDISLKALTEYIQKYRATSLTESDSFVIFGPFVGKGIPLEPTQWIAVITKNAVEIIPDFHLEKPTPIYQHKPKYPGSALREGVQGRATIRALLNTDGTVDNVELESSSGCWELDNAALECVGKWRFNPARVLDIPIKVEVSVPINFRLVDRMDQSVVDSLLRNHYNR